MTMAYMRSGEPTKISFGKKNFHFFKVCLQIKGFKVLAISTFYVTSNKKKKINTIRKEKSLSLFHHFTVTCFCSHFYYSRSSPFLAPHLDILPIIIVIDHPSHVQWKGAAASFWWMWLTLQLFINIQTNLS